MSVTSTMSTLSGCSSNEGKLSGGRRIIEPPLPPIDYDDPDSGTGDSDGDDRGESPRAFCNQIQLASPLFVVAMAFFACARYLY